MQKKLLLGSMLLVLIAIAGIVFWNGENGKPTALANKVQQEKKSVYEVNKYGETYGAYIEGTDEEPDLIPAIATNGKSGYIKQKDVDEKAGGNVNSPEEAMEYEKETKDKVIKIPVYNKDGDLVIGYFELVTGHSEDVRAGVATESMKKTLEIVPLDYHMSASKKVKGYKYSYHIHSGVFDYTSGADKGYCEGFVRIRNAEHKNVPTGYLGGLPRLYDKSKKLIVSGKWKYNGTPLLERNIYTSKIKGNGKYYYALSKARIYNGNGYDTYTCNQTPLVKVSTRTTGYRVNKQGETYGSALDEEVIGGEPDLIEAVGIGGVEGYVRASDFEIEDDTPQIAAKNSISDGEDSCEIIDLFDKDGNVIGKFKIVTNAEDAIARLTV